MQNIGHFKDDLLQEHLLQSPLKQNQIDDVGILASACQRGAYDPSGYTQLLLSKHNSKNLTKFIQSPSQSLQDKGKAMTPTQHNDLTH